MTTRAQRTTPHHVGTQPGMHPDDEPTTTGDAPARPRQTQIPRGLARPLPLPDASARPSSSWDEHEDTRVDQGYDDYDGRPITSTRRFSGSSEVPTVATPRNVIRVTHHRVPPRAHAERGAARASEPSQRHQSPRPTPTPAQTTGRRRPHYLGYVGMAMVVMVIGWLLLSLLLLWWQAALDEWRYGRPRTSQTDAVVGGDSVARPTHFIATNISGRISVIEMHASDPNNVTVLIVPMQAGPLDPVTLVVKDVNHDGKPDLLVIVHHAAHVFINDGHGTFGPPKMGAPMDMG